MAEKIKIVFLGTSSQIPTAERNHTSIFLNYKDENILVDCGEGTQRQFRKAKLNPCKLTKILITHWDADHILGIPGLLSTLAFSGYEKTLEIYGPKGTQKNVELILEMFRLKNKIKIKVFEVKGKFFESKDFFLEAEKMEHKVPCNAYNFVEKGKLRIDQSKLKKYKIFEGIHLKDLTEGKDILYKGKKFSYKNLTYEVNARKISFVLDTKINSQIVPFVDGANVLISEASFSKDMEKKAEEYMHLTSEQAGKIAKQGKVGKLYLTHLSQRFSNETETILKQAKKFFKNSYLANDLLEIDV